jgi:hypothetical protein
VRARQESDQARSLIEFWKLCSIKEFNETLYRFSSHFKVSLMNLIVVVLVVLLLLALFGGGYGFRSGNNILAGGGGIVGLILIILLILFLMGRL